MALVTAARFLDGPVADHAARRVDLCRGAAGHGMADADSKELTKPLGTAFLLHGRQGGDFVIRSSGAYAETHELQIHWISRQSHYDASGKYSLEQSLICTREVLIEADPKVGSRSSTAR